MGCATAVYLVDTSARGKTLLSLFLPDNPKLNLCCGA